MPIVQVSNSLDVHVYGMQEETRAARELQVLLLCTPHKLYIDLHMTYLFLHRELFNGPVT